LGILFGFLPKTCQAQEHSPLKEWPPFSLYAECPEIGSFYFPQGWFYLFQADARKLKMIATGGFMDLTDTGHFFPDTIFPEPKLDSNESLDLREVIGCLNENSKGQIDNGMPYFHFILDDNLNLKIQGP
jgi:hypothetical protein